MARNRRTRIAALAGATVIAAVLAVAQPASAGTDTSARIGSTQGITWGGE